MSNAHEHMHSTSGLIYINSRAQVLASKKMNSERRLLMAIATEMRRIGYANMTGGGIAMRDGEEICYVSTANYGVANQWSAFKCVAFDNQMENM